MEAENTELAKIPSEITTGKFWSDRNKEILELRIKGLGYKKIADQVGVMPNQVKRVILNPSFRDAYAYLTDSRRMIDSEVRLVFYLEAIDGIKNEIKRRITQHDLKRATLKELRETFVEFSSKVVELSSPGSRGPEKPKGILLRETLTKELRIDGEPTIENLREIARKIMRRDESKP